VNGRGARLTAYLDTIGVAPVAPATSPFDPGYDLGTVTGHLEQSAHLMASLKISMACWMIADETVTRRKVAAAAARGVPAVGGGGPFEIAVVQGQLPGYLDLCADIGLDRIECGQGFTEVPLDAPAIVRMARERGLRVQFELGSKHGGSFTAAAVEELLTTGDRWLQAGAEWLVVEARESASSVGLFDERGRLDGHLADRLADRFGLGTVVFEAPTKSSQFMLLDHFGREAQLSNVRLEELLRVEIYRRGLHADSFGKDGLRPARRSPHQPAGASS
jgi:phosphosulfolactate synthase